MSPQWYIARQGKKHGPYPFSQLQQWARSGMLLPTEMVLGNSGKWQAAGSVAGLFDVAVAAIASVPAAPIAPQATAQGVAVPSGQAVFFRSHPILAIVGSIAAVFMLSCMMCCGGMAIVQDRTKPTQLVQLGLTAPNKGPKPATKPHDQPATKPHDEPATKPHDEPKELPKDLPKVQPRKDTLQYRSSTVATEFQAADKTVTSIALSPDGELLASASHDEGRKSWSGVISLWSMKTGQLARTMTAHTKPINTIRFSPDGKRIASASNDGTVRIWDVSTGKELLNLRVGQAADWLDYDGGRLVVAPRDNTARIWEVETEKEVLVLRGHTDSVYCASFSPDLKRIATASSDKTARVWDARTGKELCVLSGARGGLRRAIFSPDGRRVVAMCSYGCILVWDSVSGQRLHELKVHEKEPIWSIAFSRDGSMLVSTQGYTYECSDARVWDMQTGKEMCSLRHHIGNLKSAIFAGNDNGVISGSDEGKIKVCLLSEAEAPKRVTEISAERLKQMGLEDITKALGTPTEIIRSTKRPNFMLYVWNTGKGLTVVHVVQRLDTKDFLVGDAFVERDYNTVCKMAGVLEQ